MEPTGLQKHCADNSVVSSSCFANIVQVWRVMERNSMAGRRKIIYGILAVLCFALLSGAALWKEKENRIELKEHTSAELELILDSDYDMVVLGDSIFGQIRDETAIPYQVAEALDMKMFNAALGGTCMGRIERTENSSDIRDALSLASISKSIAGGDFRMQKLVKSDENGTQYFPDVIEQLSWIDFSGVELLLIGYGANDYHAGEPIDSEEDPYDEYTYGGALRSAIRTLQNAYPDMRIVLVTSPYTWYTDRGLTCEEYVLGGNVLEDYVNAELAVAEELGVEIIDIYHDVFTHDVWEDWKTYSADGLHPNENGRNLISQVIIDYFEEYPEQP